MSREQVTGPRSESVLFMTEILLRKYPEVTKDLVQELSKKAKSLPTNSHGRKNFHHLLLALTKTEPNPTILVIPKELEPQTKKATLLSSLTQPKPEPVQNVSHELPSLQPTGFIVSATKPKASESKLSPLLSSLRAIDNETTDFDRNVFKHAANLSRMYAALTPNDEAFYPFLEIRNFEDENVLFIGTAIFDDGGKECSISAECNGILVDGNHPSQCFYNGTVINPLTAVSAKSKRWVKAIRFNGELLIRLWCNCRGYGDFRKDYLRVSGTGCVKIKESEYRQQYSRANRNNSASPFSE